MKVVVVKGPGDLNKVLKCSESGSQLGESYKAVK